MWYQASSPALLVSEASKVLATSVPQSKEEKINQCDVLWGVGCPDDNDSCSLWQRAGQLT